MQSELAKRHRLVEAQKAIAQRAKVQATNVGRAITDLDQRIEAMADTAVGSIFSDLYARHHRELMRKKKILQEQMPGLLDNAQREDRKLSVLLDRRSASAALLEQALENNARLEAVAQRASREESFRQA